MNADDCSKLTAMLTNHMDNVRRHFNELIGDDEAETREEPPSEQSGANSWQGRLTGR